MEKLRSLSALCPGHTRLDRQTPVFFRTVRVPECCAPTVYGRDRSSWRLRRFTMRKAGISTSPTRSLARGASISCLCRAVCIYEASSPEAIHEHTLRGDLPVTEIIAIADTVVVRQIPPRPPRKQTRDNTRTRHRVAGRDTDGHVAGGVLLPPA